jgi:hypothetical protein
LLEATLRNRTDDIDASTRLVLVEVLLVIALALVLLVPTPPRTGRALPALACTLAIQCYYLPVVNITE